MHQRVTGNKTPLFFISCMCLLFSGCHLNSNTESTSQANFNLTPPAPPISTNAVTSSKTPAPQLDNTTPDRALKSYWAMEDYATHVNRSDKEDVFRESQVKNYNERVKLHSYWSQVAGGAVLDEYSPDPNIPMKQEVIQSYDRDISDVNMQTASRAVITANVKNSTPLPNNTTLSEEELGERYKGTDYKYILEKDSTGWKVTSVNIYDNTLEKWDTPPGLDAAASHNPNLDSYNYYLTDY